jgi:hypothetical protein
MDDRLRAFGTQSPEVRPWICAVRGVLCTEDVEESEVPSEKAEPKSKRLFINGILVCCSVVDCGVENWFHFVRHLLHVDQFFSVQYLRRLRTLL